MKRKPEPSMDAIMKLPSESGGGGGGGGGRWVPPWIKNYNFKGITSNQRSKPEPKEVRDAYEKMQSAQMSMHKYKLIRKKHGLD